MKSFKLLFVFTILVAVFTGVAGCTNIGTPSSSDRPASTGSPPLTTLPPATIQVATSPVVTAATSVASTIPPKPTQTTVSLSPSPSQPVVRQNIIIDHTNWDWYNSQPQSVIDSVAQQKIFFAHASTGGNILAGMRALHSADALKYPITQVSVTGTPPASVSEGTIYEYSRGNPGWAEKIAGFETYITNGWSGPTVYIVMNKFCYVDPSSDWQAYVDSMVALESKYPGTVFVYWTMPLMTNNDSDEVLRSQFNQNLRTWITTQNNKVLFDLADIAAWDPNGQLQSFSFKAATYEKMYSGYSSDGGHLNDSGSLRAATGLYSLFGKIVSLGLPE